MSEIYKIYNYTNSVEPDKFVLPPYDINYNVLGLSKKRNYNSGELDTIDYYGYVDSGGTYQDLVLTEYRQYYRKDRMVFMRIVNIDWYLSNGDVGGTKKTEKYYSLEESIRLGTRRRGNIISSTKIEIIGLIQMVKQCSNYDATITGMYFLDEFSNEIYKYIEGVEEPLKEKLNTCEHHDWLLTDLPGSPGIMIKDYLINKLTFDYSDKLP